MLDPLKAWARRFRRRIIAVASIIAVLAMGVRLPQWIGPQDPEFAIVQQARRFVPVGDFYGGDEDRELVSLHEFAMLAAEVYDNAPAMTEYAKANDWMPCVKCAPLEQKAKDGLAFRVWLKKRTNQPKVAVVAFRGTRPEDLNDWFANARWVTRLIPFTTDHYDQVQELTPTLIPLIESEAGEVPEIVTTGHSLGGGLAQQAGYMDPRIKRVYAFDSSPVTGYYDVDSSVRDRAKKGKRIYRIYERGEILGYLRSIMKWVYPVPDRDPEVVEIRFNFGTGNGVAEHSMETLAQKLIDVAEEKRRSNSPVSHQVISAAPH